MVCKKKDIFSRSKENIPEQKHSPGPTACEFITQQYLYGWQHNSKPQKRPTQYWLHDGKYTSYLKNMDYVHGLKIEVWHFPTLFGLQFWMKDHFRDCTKALNSRRRREPRARAQDVGWEQQAHLAAQRLLSASLGCPMAVMWGEKSALLAHPMHMSACEAPFNAHHSLEPKHRKLRHYLRKL